MGNDQALATVVDKGMEFTPFMSKSPIRLSVAIVQNMIFLDGLSVE